MPLYSEQMSEITLPHPKKRLGSNAETTHMRVYRLTLADLHTLAERWNTTVLEAQRFLAEAGTHGLISPEMAQNHLEGQENALRPS